MFFFQNVIKRHSKEIAEGNDEILRMNEEPNQVYTQILITHPV